MDPPPADARGYFIGTVFEMCSGTPPEYLLKCSAMPVSNLSGDRVFFKSVVPIKLQVEEA